MAQNLKKYKGIIITAIVALVGGFLAHYGISLTATQTDDGGVLIEASYKIELSEEQVPAVIETDEGEIVVDIPTVEEIDSPQLMDECGEGEDCGKGCTRQ